MVARHAEHFVAAVAQPFQELAGFLELLGPGTLGEIATDDDKVGLELIDLPVDGFDEALVVRTEVQVGEVDDAGHRLANAKAVPRFSGAGQKFSRSKSLASMP